MGRLVLWVIRKDLRVLPDSDSANMTREAPTMKAFQLVKIPPIPLMPELHLQLPPHRFEAASAVAILDWLTSE